MDRGTFASAPHPHTSKRVFESVKSGPRAPSDGFFPPSGKKHIESFTRQSSIVKGADGLGPRPGAERVEKCHRHMVDGHLNNKSVCPWKAYELPGDDSFVPSRKIVPQKSKDDRRFGKGLGPLDTNGDKTAYRAFSMSQPKPERAHKRMSEHTAWNTRTTEQSWRPQRKAVPAPRSQSADFARPGRSHVSTPTHTSLWGPDPNSTPAPRGRGRSTSPQPSMRESPFATSLDAARESPNRGGRAMVRSHSNLSAGCIPYDASYDSQTDPHRDDVGRRTVFKPRTRLFSSYHQSSIFP